MPLTLSSYTSTSAVTPPASGIVFVPTGTATTVYRHTQNLYYFYDVITFGADTSGSWPPGDCVTASALRIQTGSNWCDATIFTYNTTGTVNIYSPVAYQYNSFTHASGMGLSGVIHAEPNAMAMSQQAYVAGNVASSVNVDYTNVVIPFNSLAVIDGSDGGIGATNLVDMITRWGPRQPSWQNEAATWNSNGWVDWNPMWRTDLVL